MKKFGILTCRVLLSICVLGFFNSVLIAKESPSPSPGADSETPEVYVPTGFPRVVVVSGTNYEMGVQYGEQTANATIHNLALYKSKLYKIVPGGPSTVTTDMQAWDYYLRKYDPTLKEWLDGMRRDAKTGDIHEYLDVILLMVYPGVGKTLKPYPAEMKRRVRTSGSWKTGIRRNRSIIPATVLPQPGPPHPIKNRSCDYPDGWPEMMDNIILLAFPESGDSFVSQTYAGRVNANSAMNSSGLAWTMTAITSHEPVWGMTEVYFHYLAQVASSRADAIKYIEKTPRGGVAGGFILSDPTGIDVFETFADASARRSPSENGGLWFRQTIWLTRIAVYSPNWCAHGQFEQIRYRQEHMAEAAPAP